MAAVVINHLTLDVPVDELADVIDETFAPAFLDQPGFQHFYLVRTAEREATVVIVWASEAEAAAGAGKIGATVFNQYITPHLAKAPDSRVGKVVAEVSS
jgi:hypothetical protein